jgi:hypothetical protein
MNDITNTILIIFATLVLICGIAIYLDFEL